MTATAFTLPGTPANLTFAGTPSWSAPNNAKTTNATGTTCSAFASGQISQVLRVTNFGFAIPAGATINGVRVSVTRKSTTGAQIRDTVVQLVNGSANTAADRIGTSQGLTATNWPSSYTAQIYGGTANLWGATLTPAVVNSANFGVDIQAQMANGAVADVDSVSLEITYTVSATPFAWSSIDLTAGTVVGNTRGYAGATGSITGQPVSGKTLTQILTNGIGTITIAFSGDTTANTIPDLYIGGTGPYAFTGVTGSYNGSTTTYQLSGSGFNFTSGSTYTIATTVGPFKYKGAAGQASRYLGSRTEAQLYLGTEDLWP